VERIRSAVGFAKGNRQPKNSRKQHAYGKSFYILGSELPKGNREGGPYCKEKFLHKKAQNSRILGKNKKSCELSQLF
jgi:hypothetical protein